MRGRRRVAPHLGVVGRAGCALVPRRERLREELVRGLQKHIEVDEPEENDEIEMMTAASLANEVGMEAAAAGVGADTSDKSAPDYGADDVTED